MTIRTILVDDEPLATQGLRLRLEAHDDVEIVATAANGREAIRAIKTHKPDLVFLDIQMPGFDGFSVIQGLMEVEPPLFVFVTAYGDHAIRAFEAQAVDYLMKPVEEDRLAATLDRVRQRLAEKRGVEEVERLKEALDEHAPEAAEELCRGQAAPKRIAANRFEKMINIKDQGQIFRVDVDTIERIDAAGDYMCIMTGDNTLILRETMKDLEKRLDPRRFQRVHRSTIVNLDLVKQVKPHTNGECFLVLDSGRAGEGQPQLSRRGGAVRSLEERRAWRKVTGLGGIFYKVADPAATQAWYQDNLGVGGEWGAMFPFKKDDPEGFTLLSPFKADSDYFAPSAAPFMINLRVDDLDGMIADLDGKGIAILGRQDEDYGRFAWILDPDGIKVELWQQIGGAPE